MSAGTLVKPRGDFGPGNIDYHAAEAVRWLIRREDQVQAHVAISAGVDPEELSRYMTGVESFPVVVLMSIAEGFGISPAKLLEVADALSDGADPASALQP